MQEVTFEVETITPLFLAGADQTTAELRAPSFRGEMRYWLRALVGGLVGTGPEGLKTVRDAETEVFGATNRGSVVQVRVSGQPTKLEEFRRESRGRDVTGKDYLLWSMVQSGRADRGNLKPARWYFPPGTRFHVTLTAHDSNEVAIKKGIAAFWLLTHLGSIGSRSRRCAGSLQATGETATLPFDIPQTAQALQDQLTRGIQAAHRLYEGTPTPSREAAFDALSPATCRIWILRNGERPWPNADAAMRDIGASLQNYRREINPIQRRKIFGLPLMGVDNRNRRSSPLLLRITKLQGEQYVGVAVLFKTKVETRTEQFSTADYTLIDRWVTQGFPQALEVKL